MLQNSSTHHRSLLEWTLTRRPQSMQRWLNGPNGHRRTYVVRLPSQACRTHHSLLGQPLVGPSSSKHRLEPALWEWHPRPPARLPARPPRPPSRPMPMAAKRGPRATAPA
jgi:hypothetical protein